MLEFLRRTRILTTAVFQYMACSTCLEILKSTSGYSFIKYGFHSPQHTMCHLVGISQSIALAAHRPLLRKAHFKCPQQIETIRPMISLIEILSQCLGNVSSV
ncbi:hypothetical protein TNIN_238001 [Trichonephila inaurata madagascariensis]|uniref:Uncharacterized protein n=1 Tax=Trichonephila inaurata madagascariensis TaxID=2747483 RepID=A0A8X6WYE1_9ARAC|nr:hypothetical protein TNIN_238001 [Trichonephila inaurata madagascariensis]